MSASECVYTALNSVMSDLLAVLVPVRVVVSTDVV